MLYSKNKARKVSRKFLAKSKADLGDRYDYVRMASRVTTATMRTTKKYKLTPKELMTLIFLYPYEFVSKRFVAEEGGLSVRTMKHAWPKMIKKELIQLYSRRFKMDIEKHVASTFGNQNYTVVESKTVYERYCLTSKGKEIVEEFHEIMAG